MPKVLGAIPAAAGYPQYSGNLILPQFGQELIERFYCTTVFGEISNTNYIGNLSRMGDQITFFREPRAVVRPYIKDMTLKHDTLTAESVTLTVDKANYFSLKIDRIDQHQMGPMWQKMRDAFVTNAAREIANTIDCQLLGTVYTKADCANRGPQAGCQSGMYNLGTVGNPVVVTPNNIVQVLINLQAVLTEACVPREGRYVVLPPIAEAAILQSPLGAACCSSDKAYEVMLNGRMPGTIAGFKVLISPHVPKVFDAAAGVDAYQIIAGVQSSTVFASQLDEVREMQDFNNFDNFLQGLSVYGFDVIEPKGLVSLYARFA